MVLLQLCIYVMEGEDSNRESSSKPGKTEQL